MASIDLDELYTKYEGFYEPRVAIEMGGQDISEFKKFTIEPYDISVELTSDLKASVATFCLANTYDAASGGFRTKDLKKYISLGTDVTIYMGHAASVTEVFKGYVAGVDFVYDFESRGKSYIRITAMDIKGLMMANNYSKRLKANYYSDAVKEILDQQVYQNLQNNGVIDSITIADTPDKPAGGAPGGGGAAPGGAGGAGTPDIRIEMVAESDYDFVVKVAKRFNYEFFSLGGNVAFRKAKSNTQPLAEITPHYSILDYNIGYDITGVVGEVKVRTLDVGKGTKIEVKKKNSGKFSMGSKAKPLISSQQYVYIDSSIESQTDAERRAEYILEDMSYRLGHITMTLRGMPEFVPGRFVTLKGFGDGASNNYYITDVKHEYMGGGRYVTVLEGKAATL
ncbi:MAG: phage late control D family protein [Lachnospiraceae bacterium]|nr:phage late control D family protein [Lachnospiraceae bacterium]